MEEVEINVDYDPDLSVDKEVGEDVVETTYDLENESQANVFPMMAILGYQTTLNFLEDYMGIVKRMREA